MFDPKFREGQPSDVLVKGDAPLLRGTVDALVDLIEAWLDLALTAEEEQTIRDGLESSWAKLGTEDKRWYDRQAIARERLRNVPPAEAAEAKRALLQGFGVEVDARAAKQAKFAWADAVRRARARKVTLFSPTPEPAVPVAAVEAFESLVDFLVCVARNDPTVPTEGQRIASRPALKKAMDASGPAVRRHYARFDRLWLLVQARWDAADEAGKLRFRWAVLKFFRPIAHLPPLDPAQVIDLAAYARSADEVARSLSMFDAYTNAFANLGTMLTITVEGLGLDAKDLEPAFSQDSLSLH